MCNCRFVESVITAVLCGVDSFAAWNLAKVWLRCEFNKVRFDFNVPKLYRAVIRRKLSLQILRDKCHWVACWAKDTIACNSAISGCSRSRQWQAGTFISQVPRIHGRCLNSPQEAAEMLMAMPLGLLRTETMLEQCSWDKRETCCIVVTELIAVGSNRFGTCFDFWMFWIQCMNPVKRRSNIITLNTVIFSCHGHLWHWVGQLLQEVQYEQLQSDLKLGKAEMETTRTNTMRWSKQMKLWVSLVFWRPFTISQGQTWLRISYNTSMKLIESQHWQMSLHLLENMRCHVVNADSSSYTANLNSSDTKTCYANRNLNMFFVLSCGTFDFLSSTALHCLLLPHWSISGQKNLGQSFCSSSQRRIRRRRIWKAKMRPSVPVEKQILRQEIRSEVLHNMTNLHMFLTCSLGKSILCVFFLVCFGLEWFVGDFHKEWQHAISILRHGFSDVITFNATIAGMWSALAERRAAFVGNEGNEDARTLGNATRKTSCVWCCVLALIWPSHSWINACFSEFISAFNVW